ncbi:MAG: AAA family ATPase [Candidatus Symbiothrix sp.]|jgi:wobble nucleotide-excising tRNase|nr:AAA family ATPase [Candidatus Symbiothrix sp.]
MISKIESINDFGIYKNFNWNSVSSIDEFKAKNIIYGWNYSGKTTFSRIFSSLRDKEIYKDFQNGDFKVTTGNGTFNKSNIESFPYGVLVFNSDYIKENLKWDYDENINAIFFEVGEDAKIALKIEELENLILKINGSDSIVGKKSKFQKTINTYEFFEDTLFTEEAKKIKDDHFISLINFNKTNLKKIKDYIINNIDNQIIKDKKVLAKTSKIIKIEKPKPIIDEIVFNNNYDEIEKKVNEILSTTPTKSDIIAILDKRKDAYDWVRNGLKIHGTEKKCFFCDNTILDERINLLNLYFENQASILKEKCRGIIHRLNEEIESIDKLNFPNSHNDFNEGFQEEYTVLKQKIDNLLNDYVIYLQSLIKKINNKVEKNIYTPLSPIKKFDINTISQKIELLNNLIKDNNKFSMEFNTIIEKERDKYKNHLVANFLKSTQYITKESKAKKAYVEIEKLDKEIEKYQKEINRLKALKESDSEGCAQFNSFVQSFLSRDDIEIKLNEETRKFNLLRGNELAKNLSEGEKMAISFSHFLVTIKAIKGQNKFQDYIVFIDDPISSLDGNHIFQINSLLKETFFAQISDPNQSNQLVWNLMCKQLFVSTHNFDFFNLLKELPKKGYKKESRYFISRKINEAFLENLPAVYNNYQSEYHYLFGEIMSFYNDTNKPAYPKLLLMPNVLRRFLEMYTLTQYPINDELDTRADKIFGKQLSKRICKPFHYFSHFNNIDRITKQSEFIADISKACEELINHFEKIDDNHYQALKQSIS